MQTGRKALTIQGCCAMSEAGICDPNACLQKCLGGSNLHNASAGPPGSPSQSLYVSPGGENRINCMEAEDNNRPVDMSSPQTLGGCCVNKSLAHKAAFDAWMATCAL